jgi:hypothetical protein
MYIKYDNNLSCEILLRYKKNIIIQTFKKIKKSFK